MPASTLRIVCEIHASDAAITADLGHIVETCSRETGVPVCVKLLPVSAQSQTLTLRLPVGLAASQHPVWCLACRLACFCPDARVSVLILGEEGFAPPASTRDRKRVA